MSNNTLQMIRNDCPELLREFLFYMETIRGRSQRTVQGYYIDLRSFLRYIKSVKMLGVQPANDDVFHQIKIADVSAEVICAVTLSDVYEYLHFTLSELKNASAARARKVSSIRAFYKYITTKTTLLEDSPVKNLEVPAIKKALPKYLTLEESLELLTNVNSSFTQRDYCIITLFLNCGMRVSELVGINLDDIRYNTLKLLGKGNKERIVYLNEACVSAIKNYLAVRETDVSPGSLSKADKRALFLSKNGQRLTVRRVEQIVGQCLTQAGLSGQGYSPHKLRHTAATLMYQHGGVDIRVLKEILGHSNLGTTEIYTHVSNEQIENAADKNPLSAVKKKNSPPIE